MYIHIYIYMCIYIYIRAGARDNHPHTQRWFCAVQHESCSRRCVTVCCSVFQRVRQHERQQEHDSVMQSFALFCIVLQYVAVCCRERNNPRIAAWDVSVCHMLLQPISLQGGENALGCIVVQVSFCKRFCRFFFGKEPCDAVCCSVLEKDTCKISHPMGLHHPVVLIHVSCSCSRACVLCCCSSPVLLQLLSPLLSIRVYSKL